LVSILSRPNADAPVVRLASLANPLSSPVGLQPGGLVVHRHFGLGKWGGSHTETSESPIDSLYRVFFTPPDVVLLPPSALAEPVLFHYERPPAAPPPNVLGSFQRAKEALYEGTNCRKQHPCDRDRHPRKAKPQLILVDTFPPPCIRSRSCDERGSDDD